MDKNVSLYEDYFLSQSGAGGINVFSGPRYMRGRGLGSILGGLGRVLLPLLKRGGRVLLKEGLRTGTDIVGDVLDGQNFKSSLKKRGREGGERIVHRAMKRMRGEGIMAAPPGQSIKSRRSRKRKKKLDITRKRKAPKQRMMMMMKKKKKKKKKKTTGIKHRRSKVSTQKTKKRSAGKNKQFRDIFS